MALPDEAQLAGCGRSRYWLGVCISQSVSAGVQKDVEYIAMGAVCHGEGLHPVFGWLVQHIARVSRPVYKRMLSI